MMFEMKKLKMISSCKNDNFSVSFMISEETKRKYPFVIAILRLKGRKALNAQDFLCHDADGFNKRQKACFCLIVQLFFKLQV